MDLTLAAITRGIVNAISSYGVPRAPEVDVNGNLFVTQYMPERAHLVAQANSFMCVSQVAATFLNIVQPTTGFALALLNNDLVKSYIIDRVFYTNITAVSAAAQAAQMFGALVPPSNPISTMTGTLVTPATMFSLASKVGGYSGSAVVKGVGALTALPAVTAASWAPLGQGIPLAASAAGFCGEAFCYGRYVVRPGAAFLVNVAAGAATGTFFPGIEWHEAILPIN